MSLRHGFDGNAPITEEVLDRDGKGKRELTRTIRRDVMDRLVKRHFLKDYHEAAADVLSEDVRLALLQGYAALGSVRGGNGGMGLPDTKLDAMARVNAAHEHIGDKGDGWRIVEMVVLEDVELWEVARRLRIAARGVLPTLQSNLATLWTHYDRLGRFLDNP